MGARGRASRAGLVVLLATGLAGCVEREWIVRTDPPGARVFVDGRDAGTSPVTMRYRRPGRHDVRIELEGFRTVADEVTTPTTWDAVPGPDFLAENVYPGTIRRSTVSEYRLERLSTRRPGDATDAGESPEALLSRARAFRARAVEEAEADPATPARPAPGR